MLSIYRVSGYSDVVVYAMLRYIYGFPLDEDYDEFPGEEQFNYFFIIIYLVGFFLCSLYYTHSLITNRISYPSLIYSCLS